MIKKKPKEKLSEIIYEKNDILILGVDNSDGMTFYYIDKKELKFYMSVLERTVILGLKMIWSPHYQLGQ
jgi:hypothetical protein